MDSDKCHGLHSPAPGPPLGIGEAEGRREGGLKWINLKSADWSRPRFGRHLGGLIIVVAGQVALLESKKASGSCGRRAAGRQYN